MPTEADTCRKFVVPKLQAAGWDNEPYSIAEQRTITDGRIVPVGKGFVRRPSKRVDYLLRYRRDFPLADKPLSRTLIPTAGEIFAFDHFIANPDRTVANPNLLFNGREFAIYDHELAFFMEGILGWRPPWEEGGAQFPQGMPPQSRHVFLEELRGEKLDLDRLSGAFDVISDRRLNEYTQAVPREWVGDGTSINRILGYIGKLKEKLPLAMDQIVQALL